LGIIALVDLLVALTSVIATIYHGVRRRWERAKTAGVFAAVGIVSAGSSGLTMPTEPAPQEAIARGDLTPRAQEPGSPKEERPTEVPQEPEVVDAPAVVAELESQVLSQVLYCTEFGDVTRCKAGDPTPGSRGYMVLISPGSGSVEYLEAHVYGYTAVDARFLGEIAAIKMREGIDPEAARRWVMANAEGAVANPAGKKFGGLAYSIAGLGEMRFLTVGEI